VNALANDKVADYINENFVATYMKVGTFQIINGQKVGGNVASYFCLPDGSVVHAVPGQVDADKLLTEARWAHDAHTYALTRSTIFFTGAVDPAKYRFLIRQAHAERFALEKNPDLARNRSRGFIYGALPPYLPKNLSTLAQAHWYLGTNPLAKIDTVFPFVWEHILNERLSGLPVAMR
jgi:hypothetical protein